MGKYLKSVLLGLVILALLPLVALATEDCATSCDSEGIECGTWNIGGVELCCGTCPRGSYCDHGACEEYCESHDERRCYRGDVWWYDSCGNRESRYDTCEDYCRDGRCRDYDDDDDYYHDHSYYYYDDYYGGYYSGHYYYDSSYYSSDYPYWDARRRCDTFCNYPSVCAETGRNGCGSSCSRQTEGIGCGVSGVCSGGTCISRESSSKEEAVVQGMAAYNIIAYPVPIQKESEIGISDAFVIAFLLAGSVLFLVVIGMLVMYMLRR